MHSVAPYCLPCFFSLFHPSSCVSFFQILWTELPLGVVGFCVLGMPHISFPLMFFCHLAFLISTYNLRGKKNINLLYLTSKYFVILHYHWHKTGKLGDQCFQQQLLFYLKTEYSYSLSPSLENRGNMTVLWCSCVTVLAASLTTFWGGVWELHLIPAMDEDTPTLKPRRIQNQNVVHRLERRRICSGRPGAHWYRVRCFHQNLFPNFTVVNVEKPPCFLRKFSPDGRCFIAFSSDQTSLEVRWKLNC